MLNVKKFISAFMACTIACSVVYSAGAGFIPAAVAAVTVDKPVPSIPGGRYEQSINVELSTTTPGADIYYTLDGTLPDETSIKYNGTPIVLTESTNVSVIAMKDGGWSIAGTYGYIIKTTEKPLLKFAAMGDVHMAPGTAEDDANNRARWVSNFDVLGSVLPNPDAIVFAGDMINDNNFNTGQHHSFVYDILKTQMERKGWSGMQMQIAIGNHDARVSDVQKGYPAEWFTSQSNGYYEKTIKGYSFFFVNANNYNGDTTQRNWLRGRLAAITADPASRNKPIFLTLHHPIAGTVMDGQQASNGNLNADLKDFPQVVVLSGHSHLNINDERSIFQKDFTVINVGSMSYLETEYGYSMVTKEGGLNETALFSGTQSPIIEVYQDRIEIERIEYQWGKGSAVPAFNSAGALAGKKWVVKLSGNTNEEIKSNFTYKPQNRNKVAPEFPVNLNMKVEKRADNVPVLSFKQATDDDSMHHYEVKVYDYRTAQVEKTYNVLSDFYFTPIPNNMNIPMKDLNPAKTYLISVKATDATGNSSAPVQMLYASQVAPPAPTPIDPTTMWNQLVSDMKFNGNLNEDASGTSGAATQAGSVSFVTGKSGQALSIAAGNTNYVDLGDRSDLKFGNGDFTISFWHKGNLAADQTVLSNKNWNSGGNLGWYIGPATSNNMTLNLANGAGNRIDYSAASVGQEWHYFTISVDRANHTASTYVDGIKQAIGNISTLGTSSLDTNFHIILGADGNKGNGGADVTLDDLKIWKRALSATEAKALSDSYQSANLFNFSQLTSKIQEAEQFAAHVAGITGASIPAQVQTDLTAKLAAAKTLTSGSEAAVIDLAYMELMWALQMAQAKLTYTFVPKKDFSIDSFSSYADNDGDYASNILDDSLSSIWHSKWQSPVPDFPHWVIVDMKSTHSINGVNRKSRLNQGDMGFPKTFELYASDNLADLKNTVYLANPANKVTGTFGKTWTGTVYSDYASFGKTLNGRYVKFVVTSTYNTNSAKFTSMSEIDFTGEQVSSGDATLTDLKLNGVSLSGFAPDKFDYAMSVPYETTATTVTYTAGSPAATVAVNGGGNLVVGNNPVTVTVTAQDGTTRVYSISVTRQTQALSSDASLVDLGVNGTTVHGFATDKLSYALSVPYETTVTTVTYTAASPSATVAVNGGENLVVGNNAITVTVTAQDGTTKIYSIAVTRQTQSLSSDASLVDLRVNGTTVNGFASDKLGYALLVPYETTVTTVTYTAASSAATVAVHGGENLVVGNNAITVTVTAQDGTTKIYSIAVTRQTQALSSDASLVDLRVNGTTVNGFASDKLGYALLVPYVTTVTKVTYTAASLFATVAVNGGENLVVGNNPVTVTVTAQDGTTKVYSIAVTRQTQALSSDASLVDLRVNGTTVNGFASDKLGYALLVPYETTVTTVTYTAASSAATVAVHGGENLVVGNNAITVTVTAQDGTFKQYGITVNRSSNSDPGPSETPGSSTTPDKPKLPEDAVIIKDDDLKENQSSVSVELPEGKNRVIIGVEQAEQFNGRTLQVQAPNVKLTLPGDLLKSASDLLPEPDNKAEITVKIEPVAAEQAERTLQEASRKDNANYKLGGQMVALSIFVTNADGKQFVLAKLDKPVTMTFPIPAGMDPKLAGIYEIKKDGSLVYLGGKRVNGNTAIEVGTDRLSQYAVLSLEKNYNDVTNQHWAYSTIRELSAQHIVNGATDATFAPGKDISRAEFAALLARTLGLSSADTSPFGDVTEKDWYAKEVAAAYKAGIITGNAQQAFEPNRSITREEMAVMLVRAYEHRTGSKLEASSEASSDASEISDWALPFVNSALKAKLLSGRQEGLFVPDEHTTRAEAAQAIYNLLK
ncbi:cadherin-like beta sandwich domain-containing protein [Paenibacillus sp. HWE-109]|uniref:cadherin-like beta sandwich domain-containing protein n=1 Tax=Paenibacillus sp. HWE-109 TaxID=1306526 RepID=UPI001EDE0630|nr:cadherin-like beta sandwich domain-containing protein [Paenibacillus sp. HWE-109]UKS24085.1 cadherin-like beta sandwich domain-containing protein [Paenibacillus sp. HWE-109]